MTAFDEIKAAFERAEKLIAWQSLEIKRLMLGLEMIRDQSYDRGYSAEDFAEAVLGGIEPIEGDHDSDLLDLPR
jgi:hypothetical protein